MSSQAPLPVGVLPAVRASSTHPVTHLLILGTLLASTGCQAITTIFEAGIWVGVILVLVVLGAVAFVLRKFRGRGGPPRGTAAVAVLLLGTGLSARAPHPAAQGSPVGTDQERVGTQQRPDSPALDDVRLQGCVARDTGWQLRRPDAAVTGGSAPSPAQGPQGHGEMFVLRGARRLAADADASAGSGSPLPGETYRLAPRAGLSLSPFEGQRVEVRGRLRDGDDPEGTSTARATSIDRRNSQAVQGGQMQAVGQTMSGGQGGQSGQTTEAPRTPSAAGPDGATGDAVRRLVVSSVRVLAPTCGAP